MRKTKSSLIPWLLLFLGMPAQAAEYGIALQLESHIGSRVRTLVHAVDSSAQILVRVQLRKTKGALPGTLEDYEGALGVTSLSKLTQADMSKIEVRIISRIDPFPEQMLSIIRDDLGIEGRRLDLVTEKMDVRLQDLSKKGSELKELIAWLEGNATRVFTDVRLWSIAFFGLCALFFVAYFLNALRSRKAIVGVMLEIREQFSRLHEMAGNSPREINVGKAHVVDQPAQRLPQQQAIENDGFSDLSIEGMVALFSDCYWTNQDPYAAWLWRKLSLAQRGAMIQAWPESAEYVKSLASVVPSGDSYHHHPYYLNPKDLRSLSQPDLASWLTRFPTGWNAVSPMRQAHLPVSFLDKLRWSTMSSDAHPADATFPKVASAKRNFDSISEFGEISLEDEERIFLEPDLAPEGARSKIPSLIWLANLPKQARETVLEAYSASDLAHAWVGPSGALSLLEQALPEKKRKLLESYRQTVSPSRSSPVFMELFKEGLSKASVVPIQGKGVENEEMDPLPLSSLKAA
jgi:hypothetical protein